MHERRDAFGVRPPVLAKPELAVYEETWAPWETPLYDLAHEQGLPAEQVRGLRDEAIKLGQMIGDRGKPATADELKQVFERLKVPAASRPALVKLWERLQGAAE